LLSRVDVYSDIYCHGGCFLEPSVRVMVHGVPDRIIYAASRARQLASAGLDATGIADRVRALHESEAVAG
jgi:1-deoxy-D-xylulose-5-phosphate synthase